ncbi:hypothetical protein LEP1GSC005_2915 [Leptospira santarosai str. ST188]|nr:hypothetical protein LEP1GSC005_2915 [Leptospira santarosai str. ST188]
MKGFKRFFHDRHRIHLGSISISFKRTMEVFNNSIHNRFVDILIRLLINPFGL